MIKTKIFTPLPLVDSEEKLEELQKAIPRYGPRGGMVVKVEGQSCVKIPLSQGHYALIDLEDYPVIGAFRWCSHHRYAMRNTWDGKVHYVSMSRQILGFPECFCDHKNGDTLDNRRTNLRQATRSQNCANAVKRCGAAPWKGIWWDKRRNGWKAEVTQGDKHFKSQLFQDPMEAAKAYDSIAREVFGEYARLNFGDQL